jgi:hypothetical protein
MLAPKISHGPSESPTDLTGEESNRSASPALIHGLIDGPNSFAETPRQNRSQFLRGGFGLGGARASISPSGPRGKLFGFFLGHAS